VFEARRDGVAAVVIGVDPRKLSATIEVLNEQEKVLGGGGFGTDPDGYRQLLAAAARAVAQVRIRALLAELSTPRGMLALLLLGPESLPLLIPGPRARRRRLRRLEAALAANAQPGPA